MKFALAAGSAVDHRAVRILDQDGQNVITVWSHSGDASWDQWVVAEQIQTMLEKLTDEEQETLRS